MKTFFKYILILILGFGLYPLSQTINDVESNRLWKKARNLEIRGQLPKIKTLSDRHKYIDNNHRFPFLKFTEISINWFERCSNFGVEKAKGENLICKYYIGKIACDEGESIEWVPDPSDPKEKTTLCIKVQK